MSDPETWGGFETINQTRLTLVVGIKGIRGREGELGAKLALSPPSVQ